MSESKPHNGITVLICVEFSWRDLRSLFALANKKPMGEQDL